VAEKRKAESGKRALAGELAALRFQRSQYRRDWWTYSDRVTPDDWAVVVAKLPEADVTVSGSPRGYQRGCRLRLEVRRLMDSAESGTAGLTG
jgi:hypothetical protein